MKRGRIANKYLFWNLKLKVERGMRELKFSMWNVVGVVGAVGEGGFLSFWSIKLWRSSSSSEDESL